MVVGPRLVVQSMLVAGNWSPTPSWRGNRLDTSHFLYMFVYLSTLAIGYRLVAGSRLVIGARVLHKVLEGGALLIVSGDNDCDDENSIAEYKCLFVLQVAM